MQKITRYVVVLILLHSSHACGMFAGRSRAVSVRALAPICRVHTVGKKVRQNSLLDRELAALAKQRFELKKRIFGHGGLLDLRSLGPDESLQHQYRDYQERIKVIDKQEEALINKKDWFKK